jgi:prevent-host-death family protein
MTFLPYALFCGTERKQSYCLRDLARLQHATILTNDGHSLAERVLSATISVAQAKSQFAALVARAEAGEKIVVTRSGRPVACLGPLPARQPIKYGDLRGVFLSEDLTIPEEVVRDFDSPE